MGVQGGTDIAIAKLAGRSHGVATRAMLLAAGLSSKEIERRLARGSLIKVHRGVYRVGHAAPSIEATYVAAVLACGPGAYLGGRAAAFLLGLIGGRPPAPRVWAPVARRVRGVVVRRHRAPWGPGETTTWRGIPTTSVARTLLDLAATLAINDLAEAFHDARIRHGTKERGVLRVAARHPRAPGRRKLTAVLLGDMPVTLSELEREFLRVLAAAGLRLPDEVNRVASARRIDCRYHRPPLTVELDSYGFHASRHAWEQDRRREREAYARGDQHRRYTYADVFEDPTLMLAELAELLEIDPI